MASYLQKRLFKSPKTRHAAESTVATSATSAEASPFASTANSAGASTNLAEISHNLDDLLAQVEQDEERLKIGQDNIANRLWSICETYEVSKLPRTVESWHCDDPTFDLIMLAAHCSETVYGRRHTVESIAHARPPEPLQDIISITASNDGSIKATLVHLQVDTKTLVITFSGTKATSPIDWLTNANGDAVDASEFLKTDHRLKAHNGFLYVARAMAAAIRNVISSQLEAVDRILLTGHSAGGAVASLLAIHFKLSNTFPPKAIHCITFGAPPAMSSLPPSTLSAKPKSLFLSFVNQGDPVPRAEKSYVRGLLDVYVRPRPEEGIEFGPAELCTCGTLLLLHDRNADSEDNEIGVVECIWTCLSR